MIEIPENVLIFIQSEKLDSCEMLNDRQKLIIRKIILEKNNFANIAFDLHISTAQVSNILKKSIMFMTNFLNEKKPDMLISQTTLSHRIKWAFKHNTNLKYVKDLDGINFRKILNMRNMGKNSLDEIQNYLEDMGMSIDFNDLPSKDKFFELRRNLEDLSKIELTKVISFCSQLLQSILIEEK